MKALNISFLMSLLVFSSASLWSQEGPPDPVLPDLIPPSLPEPTIPVPMPPEPVLPVEVPAEVKEEALPLPTILPEPPIELSLTEEPKKSAPFWECQLPSGSFLVRVSDIVTVSHHEYVADQSVRVVETTVSTRSQVVARFYHQERFASETYETPAMQEPLVEGHLALQRAQALISTGGHLRNEEQKVQDHGLPNKASRSANDPPMVDFRLKSKADVLALFQSARAAWKEEAEGLFQLAE